MRAKGILVLSLLILSACAVPPVAVTSTSPATNTSTATSAADPTTTPALTLTPAAPSHFEPFGTVSISESDTEFDVNGSGDNVDSIAFWEAPDPPDSLMMVTSKGNESVEVFQYPFTSELRTIACGDESNGIWVDQARDVLYITERHSSHVCAFDLPELTPNSSLRFTTAATGNDSEPNLAMLNLADGQSRIYVSYDERVFYHDAATGAALREFVPKEGLETMYGDDYYQVLYIPDEGGRSGVYVYDPDGNLAGSSFGDQSIFDSDAEGISVYKCTSDGSADTGEGLIVVADQKEDITDFEVFNRKTKEYLGKITIAGVNNTDGISVTQQAFPEYPLGLLAVIDDDSSTVGVGWDTLLEQTGLSCGT
jgi:Phytase